jgi:DTW domain-containing protein YfiP
MSRRANYPYRCKSCMMFMSLCICPLIPRLDTRTRLALVIHRLEARKPTNTGHIATAALVNSETFVRGHKTGDPPLTWPADSEPVLLFPAEGAEELKPCAHPVTLIVPDGNWRQAFKVRQRVPQLQGVRCATLPVGPPTMYRLRTETVPNGLATIEAIARALGILEGPEVQTALERVFQAKVERTLWIRGLLPTDEVTTGLPEGVNKHDPRSGVHTPQDRDPPPPRTAD